MAEDQGIPRDFEPAMRDLVLALKLVTLAAINEPSRRHMRELEPWLQAVFETAINPDVISGVSASWQQLTVVDDDGQLRHLLLLEMGVYSAAVFKRGGKLVSGSSASPTLSSASKRAETLARKAEQKDYLNAGSTLLESLMDALGDLAPKLRGILKSVKEAVDVAKG